MKKLIILTTALLLTLTANSQTFDKTEQLNGVSLKSSKENAVRDYMGYTERFLPHPISIVKNSITNFTEKCNNTYIDQREYSPRDTYCKYHNENLIESFIVKDIKPNSELIGVSEFYLVGRKVYNRGHAGFYELITIREGVNKGKQKTIIISLKMLDDSEVRSFTNPKFEKSSAFDSSVSVYTLTQLSPQRTNLRFKFIANTDHWLLNKEVAAPQVFASISKSMNETMETIEAGSEFQKRELASKD